MNNIEDGLQEGFVRVKTDGLQLFSRGADMGRQTGDEQDEELDEQFSETSQRRARKLPHDVFEAVETLKLDPPDMTRQQRAGDRQSSPDKVDEFLPDLSGPDPMIAVGHNYII